MRGDTKRITLNGDIVLVPLDLWHELVAFARMHGDSDIPSLDVVTPAPVDILEPSGVLDNLSTLSELSAKKNVK